MNLKKVKKLKGTLHIPGDKSISHRAVMFGALANGCTKITNFLQGDDCLSTISCFQKMGIQIDNHQNEIIVYGKGLHGLEQPDSVLNAGNSGTTTRLISGILSGQSFSSELTGDASIQKRPMDRILAPLKQMQADINSIKGNGCAPLYINGHPLTGIHYHSPVASAQVKSCILLAGLYGDRPTSVSEPTCSRDHTEIMLSAFGAHIKKNCQTVTIEPEPTLIGQEIQVPGDISSAAFFIVAGLIVPNSEICIKHVGINPTRDGILQVCHAMGADITIENKQLISGEPVADLIIRSSTLHGTVIEGSMIPTLIDELPIITVLAACAEGQTIIRDAQELKVKESNRLNILVDSLSAMGADVIGTEDGMIIQGGSPLHGTQIDSHMDHRIAMTFSIAALVADGTTTIQNAQCVAISYPTFYQDLQMLSSDI